MAFTKAKNIITCLQNSRPHLQNHVNRKDQILGGTRKGVGKRRNTQEDKEGPRPVAPGRLALQLRAGKGSVDQEPHL